MANTNFRKNDPISRMNNSNEFSISLGYKLNQRIRELRTSKGWSQTDLGEQLSKTLGLSGKIPTSTVASWEHKDPNLAKIPSQDKIEALARLFHVSEDYLKGLSDDPAKSINEYISSHSTVKNVEILPQELAQHMGEPIWVDSDAYHGWMLLTKFYQLVDSDGIIHSVTDIREKNAVFSTFPPCHAYFRQVYNRFVIPQTRIRSYKERMWVCINSPDQALQQYNGWYTKTPDGLGVKGKTILSYDSYFDLWLAYTTPLSD